MSDDLIFREVDEDVRRERMETIWKRYGAYVLVGALLVVAAVAGVVFWQNYREADQRARGAAFEAGLDLLDAGQPGEAAATFDDIAADAPEGYRALAELQAAAARQKAGQEKEALATYDRLIGDEGLTDLHRDIARIKGALLALKLDGGDAAISRLGDLPNSGSPFADAAREVNASALLAKGDRDGAIAMFREIADDANVTPAQRDRVKNYLMALGG